YANGNVEVLDVSNQFEGVFTNNNTRYVLGNISGTFTSHNALYLFELSGVGDAAGNLATMQNEQDGVFTFNVRTLDREPPSHLKVIDGNTGEEITSASALTRSKEHCLAFDAIDNLDDNLSYRFRISSDQGLNYGSWLGISLNSSCPKGSVPVAVSIAQQSLNIRLKVSDGEQFANKDFEIPLKDPNIELTTFNTVPVVVEEATDSILRFQLAGDVQLIDKNNTTIELFINNRWQPITTHTSLINDSVVAVADYFQPRLVDLLNSESTQETDVEVRLRVPFGLDAQKLFDQQYRLHKDVTAPVIQIVSPSNNGYIPWDNDLDVFIKSFDRYGIEAIEASINDGPWEVLQQPNRLVFTPTKTDYPGEINIKVRATDPNGNVSLAASIETGSEVNLTPYNAELGEPTLVLLEPKNGLNVKERDTLNVLLEISNIETAQLRLNIGGDENHPNNPSVVEISRTDLDKVILPYSLNIPAVAENMAAVIQLIADGKGRSQAFINIANDDDIAATIDIVSKPNNKILNGTTLQVSTQVQPAISDLSPSSYLSLSDGTDAPWAQLPVNEPHIFENQMFTNEQVNINAMIQDFSANQSVSTKQLEVVPYFTGQSKVHHTLQEGIDRPVALEYIQNAGFVLAVNNVYGGFKLMADSGVAYSQPEGAVSAMKVSGHQALIELEREGMRYQQLLSFNEDNVVLISEYQLEGSIIALNGKLAYTQAGQSVFAYQLLDSGALNELPAYTFKNELIQTAVSSSGIWGLTQHALIKLNLVNSGELISLQEHQRFALVDAKSMAVQGWAIMIASNNGQLGFYQYTQTSLDKTNEALLTNNILSARKANGTWWLNVESEDDLNWLAIKDAEVVAHMASTDLLALANNKLSTVTGLDWLNREVIGENTELAVPFNVSEQEAGWLLSHSI
ncbi:MAG: hypothetical protein RPR91_12100, partial [Colwellia sp.]